MGHPFSWEVQGRECRFQSGDDMRRSLNGEGAKEGHLVFGDGAADEEYNALPLVLVLPVLKC